MATKPNIRTVGVSNIELKQIKDVPTDGQPSDVPVSETDTHSQQEHETGDDAINDNPGPAVNTDPPADTTGTVDNSGETTVVVANPVIDMNKPDTTDKSKYAQTIRGMINNYISTVNNTLYAASRDMSNNINMFKAIIEYALAHPEVDVLEEVYTFFYSNKDVILDPKHALQGCRTASKMSKHVADRIETFYTLFRTITTNYAGNTNLDMARALLGNHDPIIVFVQQKLSMQGK